MAIESCLYQTKQSHCPRLLTLRKSIIGHLSGPSSTLGYSPTELHTSLIGLRHQFLKIQVHPQYFIFPRSPAILITLGWTRKPLFTTTEDVPFLISSRFPPNGRQSGRTNVGRSSSDRAWPNLCYKSTLSLKVQSLNNLLKNHLQLSRIHLLKNFPGCNNIIHAVSKSRRHLLQTNTRQLLKTNTRLCHQAWFWWGSGELLHQPDSKFAQQTVVFGDSPPWI